MKLHVELNRDHKKQIVVFRFFVMFHFDFHSFIYMLYCMLVWRTTSSQVRGDDAVSFLDKVCPWVPIESLWDEIWQSTSDKGIQDWLEGTERKVCYVHYTLSLVPTSCSSFSPFR